MSGKRTGRPRKHDHAKIIDAYRTYVERCPFGVTPSQETFVRSFPGLSVRHLRRILRADEKASGTSDATATTKPPIQFSALRQNILAALRDGGSYHSPVLSIRFLIQGYFLENYPTMTEREFEIWFRGIYPEHYAQRMDDIGVQDLCSRITTNAVGMYASALKTAVANARPK